MTLRVAGIRAILGIVFALLGLIVAVKLLISPGAINQKYLGLAFSCVLVALGVVRVRVYLKIKRETGA